MTRATPRKPKTTRAKRPKVPRFEDLDPRVVALADSRLTAIAEALSRAPIDQGALDGLRGYLDYIDHAVYSDAEIEAMIARLVAAGIAREEDGRWVYVAP